jgi:NodT family efflux transporter outer membrane factor (OMF) lipoprotein
MKKKKSNTMCKRMIYIFLLLYLIGSGCQAPKLLQVAENRSLPKAYGQKKDSATIAAIPWKQFFTDPLLQALIDTALVRNQELNSTWQEIQIARNEVRMRRGILFPSVGARVGMGVEKVGRYTSQGAGDASTEIEPGKEVPDPLTDITAGLYANWELDIWKKLRNAKKASINRYLSTIEGKNFVLTNLVAEVATAYYELLALDNQLEIVQQNIQLQQNAWAVVKVQKEAARTTELAVQKFGAEVLGSQSLEFDIRQRISETENRLNFLLGRFAQPIPRDKSGFLERHPPAVQAGVPSQLLANRPDIKQAEWELAAAKLDVKTARSEFYPSVGISAVMGVQAFKPRYLARFPESILYSVAGDLAAPLINRNAIKAEFYKANARQVQAMYHYEQRIVNACLEVATQLSRMENLEKSYELKAKQVDALSLSSSIASDLFKAARADYFEVLMTQRDALEAKLELVETKKEQLAAVVAIYRDLGGGWH